MIRSLADSAGLLFARISGLIDGVHPAEEFYYIVDLPPAKFVLAVETERFINRRINDHSFKNR